MTKKDSGQGFFGIDPAGKSPVQIELEWFHKHYRGDIPQLTVRAVLIGVALTKIEVLKSNLIPVASGVIAGERLMGVLAANAGSFGHHEIKQNQFRISSSTRWTTFKADRVHG